jgi:hypothetical protein
LIPTFKNQGLERRGYRSSPWFLNVGINQIQTVTLSRRENH